MTQVNKLTFLIFFKVIDSKIFDCITNILIWKTSERVMVQ